MRPGQQAVGLEQAESRESIVSSRDRVEVRDSSEIEARYNNVVKDFYTLSKFAERCAATQGWQSQELGRVNKALKYFNYLQDFRSGDGFKIPIDMMVSQAKNEFFAFLPGTFLSIEVTAIVIREVAPVLLDATAELISERERFEHQLRSTLPESKQVYLDDSFLDDLRIANAQLEGLYFAACVWSQAPRMIYDRFVPAFLKQWTHRVKDSVNHLGDELVLRESERLNSITRLQEGQPAWRLPLLSDDIDPVCPFTFSDARIWLYPLGEPISKYAESANKKSSSTVLTEIDEEVGLDTSSQVLIGQVASNQLQKAQALSIEQTYQELKNRIPKEPPPGGGRLEYYQRHEIRDVSPYIDISGDRVEIGVKFNNVGELGNVRVGVGIDDKSIENFVNFHGNWTFGQTFKNYEKIFYQSQYQILIESGGSGFNQRVFGSYLHIKVTDRRSGEISDNTISLESRNLSSEENAYIINSALNELLMPFISRNFRQDQEAFNDHYRRALESGDPSEADRLLQSFYDQYREIPDSEFQRSRIIYEQGVTDFRISHFSEDELNAFIARSSNERETTLANNCLDKIKCNQISEAINKNDFVLAEIYCREIKNNKLRESFSTALKIKQDFYHLACAYHFFEEKSYASAIESAKKLLSSDEELAFNAIEIIAESEFLIANGSSEGFLEKVRFYREMIERKSNAARLLRYYEARVKNTEEDWLEAFNALLEDKKGVFIAKLFECHQRLISPRFKMARRLADNLDSSAKILLDEEHHRIKLLKKYYKQLLSESINDDDRAFINRRIKDLSEQNENVKKVRSKTGWQKTRFGARLGMLGVDLLFDVFFPTVMSEKFRQDHAIQLRGAQQGIGQALMLVEHIFTSHGELTDVACGLQRSYFAAGILSNINDVVNASISSRHPRVKRALAGIGQTIGVSLDTYSLGTLVMQGAGIAQLGVNFIPIPLILSAVAQLPGVLPWLRDVANESEARIVSTNPIRIFIGELINSLHGGGVVKYGSVHGKTVIACLTKFFNDKNVSNLIAKTGEKLLKFVYPFAMIMYSGYVLYRLPSNLRARRLHNLLIERAGVSVDFSQVDPVHYKRVFYERWFEHARSLNQIIFKAAATGNFAFFKAITYYTAQTADQLIKLLLDYVKQKSCQAFLPKDFSYEEYSASLGERCGANSKLMLFQAYEIASLERALNKNIIVFDIKLNKLLRTEGDVSDVFRLEHPVFLAVDTGLCRYYSLLLLGNTDCLPRLTEEADLAANCLEGTIQEANEWLAAKDQVDQCTASSSSTSEILTNLGPRLSSEEALSPSCLEQQRLASNNEPPNEEEAHRERELIVKSIVESGGSRLEELQNLLNLWRKDQFDEIDSRLSCLRV